MVKTRTEVDAMEPPSDLIQSVSRALRVLEEVGRYPQGVNPKRVAQRCELHLSTAYHLLRTLAYEGYLLRLPSGDYTLGLEIADRFRDLAAALTQPPRVEAVLRHLAAATGHTAYLARMLHGRVVIAQLAEGPASPHVEDLIPGFDEGAHATALGKALLATLDRDRRRDYLREVGLRPFTPRTVTDVEDLEAELVDLSRRGTFVEETQFRPGVSCVAALVATGDGEDRWWSIGFSARAEAFRAERRTLAHQLDAAARDLAA